MKIVNVAAAATAATTTSTTASGGPAAEEAARLRRAAFAATAVSGSLAQQARSIMEDVALHGDAAVRDYTLKFDGVMPDSLRVSRKEVEQAYEKVTESQVRAIRLMKERLEKSERALLRQLKSVTVVSKGVRIDRVVQPVSSVGCYIPGGRARYPSTVVMCAVPAKVAGVRRVVAVSPPTRDGSIDPLTLVAADVCRVDEFYKAGGAQGIAALAYGTQSIRQVAKIVGPGGMFVTAAKLAASGRVSTDMVAGPTELLVYADSTADPRLVAMDLVSQAEHSPDTVCGLVTTSEKLAAQVEGQVQAIIASGGAKEPIARADIVRKSMEQNGFAAVCKDEQSCIEFINEFAPEHLEIICRNAGAVAKKVDSAGLVLVGSDAPSSASDYCLGSNHVLPTLGFGKSRASLSVLDFVKVVNRVRVTRSGLKEVGPAVKAMAEAEGLPNHYEAVRARTGGDGGSMWSEEERKSEKVEGRKAKRSKKKR